MTRWPAGAVWLFGTQSPDRKREILPSMAEDFERATPAQLQALVIEPVERVETANRAVTRVVWTPAARPFFAAGEVVAGDSGALFWRPQGAVRAREQRPDEDPLAWYAEPA